MDCGDTSKQKVKAGEDFYQPGEERQDSFREPALPNTQRSQAKMTELPAYGSGLRCARPAATTAKSRGVARPSQCQEESEEIYQAALLRTEEGTDLVHESDTISIQAPTAGQAAGVPGGYCGRLFRLVLPEKLWVLSILELHIFRRVSSSLRTYRLCLRQRLQTPAAQDLESGHQERHLHSVWFDERSPEHHSLVYLKGIIYATGGVSAADTRL